MEEETWKRRAEEEGWVYWMINTRNVCQQRGTKKNKAFGLTSQLRNGFNTGCKKMDLERWMHAKWVPV